MKTRTSYVAKKPPLLTTKDAAEYLFVNKSPDEAVKQAAETSVREVVGRSKMDTVLYEIKESGRRVLAEQLEWPVAARERTAA